MDLGMHILDDVEDEEADFFGETAAESLSVAGRAEERVIGREARALILAEF